MKTRILMIGRNDKNSEKKEIEFEVDWMLSLTTRQRFEKMVQMSKVVRNLINNGTGRAISKNTQRA